ncbi:MAG TPA: zinc finger domain-containing protein, partial [Pyrinomonadaceae bacterium]|nr:zinc finger domain-containing protein [Pyrinomonadaceae bacterium]
EIWENLPPSGTDVRLPSVHLATLPVARGKADAALAADWEQLFVVRDEVLRALEGARVTKVIGSSLEAQVTLSAAGETAKLLKRHENELRYLFIVSQAVVNDVHADNGALGSDLMVKIDRASGQKCERCWNYSIHVGESSRYPTVCERCVAALEEIESDDTGNGIAPMT